MSFDTLDILIRPKPVFKSRVMTKSLAKVLCVGRTSTSTLPLSYDMGLLFLQYSQYCNFEVEKFCLCITIISLFVRDDLFV